MMRQAEPEHKGPLWKHPYVLYILLTGGLFTLLLTLAWLGYKSGFIAGMNHG